MSSALAPEIAVGACMLACGSCLTGIDRGAANFVQLEDFPRRSDIDLLHLTDFVATHDSEGHAIAVLIGISFYASIGKLRVVSL